MACQSAYVPWIFQIVAAVTHVSQARVRRRSVEVFIRSRTQLHPARGPAGRLVLLWRGMHSTSGHTIELICIDVVRYPLSNTTCSIYSLKPYLLQKGYNA